MILTSHGPRPSPDLYAAVDSVAAQLRHPDPVPEDTGPRSRRWWAQSIAHGAAGIAVLHAALTHSRSDTEPQDGDDQHGDDLLVHRWLSAAVAEPVSAAPGAGAWFGSPAVAFAFHHAAPSGAYRRARADLDRTVDALTRTRLDHARRRIQRRERPQLQEFDLVNGLTGLGGYLLQRDPTHPMVTDVLRYLVALTNPVDATDLAGMNVPGWWTDEPPSGRPDVSGGHSNQGAAHGIAGPLSLLALAGRTGIWVPGQHHAMRRISAWYDNLTRHAPSGPWWPQRLTWPEHRGTPLHQDGPGRPSWCYGTPGIARALQLAGIALGDSEHCRQAEQALASAVTDPIQVASLTDVSLCHGWAGTALAVWCAAHDSTDPELSAALVAALPALTTALTDATRTLPVDAPTGLIQGSAGAALTLHELARGQVGGWARCLLLL